MEFTHETFVENLIDKGGFPAAGDTGDDSEDSDGNVDGDVFKVVFFASFDVDVLIGSSSGLWHGDF